MFKNQFFDFKHLGGPQNLLLDVLTALCNVHLSRIVLEDIFIPSFAVLLLHEHPYNACFIHYQFCFPPDYCCVKP